MTAVHAFTASVISLGDEYAEAARTAPSEAERITLQGMAHRNHAEAAERIGLKDQRLHTSEQHDWAWTFLSNLGSLDQRQMAAKGNLEGRMRRNAS